MISSFESVFPSPAVLKALRKRSQPGQKIYLVGGVVRDALLEIENRDLDFAVSGDVRRLAKGVAAELGAAFYMLDLDHPTARLVLQNGENSRYILDFAHLRGEDIAEDLAGRDFTINAMAVDIDNLDRIIDPLRGAQDLKDRRLRACSPSAFRDDPVRLLRAVRISLALQLTIDPATIRWMKEASADLATTSNERQRDEFMRILEGQKVDSALRLLDQFGLLGQLVPEVKPLRGLPQPPPHTLDAWEHTLTAVSWLEELLGLLAADYDEARGANLLMGMATMKLGRYREQLSKHFARSLVPGRSLRGIVFLAMLLHDCAKPDTQSIDRRGRLHFYGHELLGAEKAQKRARTLALSNQEVERTVTLVRHHMRIHQIAADQGEASPRFIYRFFRDAGDAGIDLCVLSLADTLATYGVTITPACWERELGICRQLMEAWFERRQQVVDPPRLIGGDELITDLQLEPGPVIGKILAAIREAQAAGEVTTREQAFTLARHLRRGIEREEKTDDAAETS